MYCYVPTIEHYDIKWQIFAGKQNSVYKKFNNEMVSNLYKNHINSNH